MKKITLLLFLLSISLSFGQVVLDENFDAGLTLPAGWANTPNTGGDWTFETGGVAPNFGANTYLYDLADFSGNYPIFNSDAYGNDSVAENSALESPSFDCSGLTSVTLTFNQFILTQYGGEGHVEVYDGTTWTEVAVYNETNVPDPYYNFDFVSIDVSAQLAGISNAKVRFRWVGDWSYWWTIDNVKVFQCTVNAPDAVTTAVTPANGATDVEITYGDPSNLGPFEWTVPASGDPATSFNISLGTNIAGDDIGTISGFANGNSINYDWQPNTTYYWSIESVNCAGATAGTVFSFTTAACTETSAPAAASAPTPSDAATDVLIGTSDYGLDFSWTAGSPTDTFILNLGIANPPTQSFNDFENGGRITGLAENTTYYWSVDAVNCFGTTSGPVWSFTTGLALSVEDETATLFSVYPNPAKNQISINTSLTIDTVEFYNQLGQRVLDIDGASMLNNTINLSSLDSGLYFMNIAAEGKKQTIKIIKE